MPIEITVPRLGWSMEEGRFLEWLKRDGEMVRAGEVLFALDSDKVAQDVESLDSGVLSIPPQAPKPGDVVRVGQLLGYLLVAGEAAPVSTPRARRAAAELGVDWKSVPGTGRDGRIREADIHRVAPAAPAVAAPSRRVIAERMTASRQQTVPVTLHTSVDAGTLVQLRQERGAGYNDLLVKLTALALKKHPALNAGGTIHIGLAVDTESGLVAPVIRDAAALTLAEIATRTRDLAERARTRRLAAEDLQGGTFTITNLGAFGIDAFTPVINYPERAILGVGRILRRPVAVGDAIGLRDMMTLSLTFDHCALDGAPAARFLQTLCGLIARPEGLD